MDRSLDTPRSEDPHAQLERAFIEEYLRSRQHSLETVRQLPPDEAGLLLQQASVFASGRLTEVESRAHLVDELHRAPESASRAPQTATGATRAALPQITAMPSRPAQAAPPRPRRLRWL
jgi:hypothetical protein